MVSVLLFVTLLGSALSQVPAPGSPIEMDRTSPMYMEVVRMAADHASSSSNSVYHLKPTHVLEATQQVVAGILYKVKLELDFTTCLKRETSAIEAEHCEFSSNSRPTICSVAILSQPWLIHGAPTVKILSSHCSPKH